MNVGLSFSPFNQGSQGQGMGQSRAVSPVQDAIKILSLRPPTNVGAPPSGVMGSGSAYGAQSNTAMAANLLRMLFGGGAAAGGGAGTDFSNVPPPTGYNGAPMPGGMPDFGMPSFGEAGPGATDQPPPPAMPNFRALIPRVEFGQRQPGVSSDNQPDQPDVPPMPLMGGGQGGWSDWLNNEQDLGRYGPMGG